MNLASNIHVQPGASFRVAFAADDRETRFCFKCRMHLPHRWWLLEDPPERQPSYYDPIPACLCERCGEDHTSFPGMYPDGPRYPSEDIWRALVTMAAETRQRPDYIARLPEEDR